MYKNEFLSKTEIIDLIDFSNEDSLELLLKLLEGYTQVEIKYNCFPNIYNKFKHNSKVVSSHCSYLISVDKTDDAVTIMEDAIKAKDYDEAIIFYLASIYVKTNNLEKLISLLEIAEKKAIKQFTASVKIKPTI